MMPRFLIIALLTGFGGLSLQGCTEVGLAGEGLSLIGTKKTVGDHLVSIVSGKDCSSLRSAKGLHYCVEDEPVPEPTVHCYRTLGNISCYEKRDPYQTGEKEVGDNDHNLQHLQQ